MYCSSCGEAAVPDLSYCKRCGSNLSGTKADEVKSSVLSPTSLVWAMVSVFIGGIAAIVALMAVMKGADPSSEALIKAFVLLCFLLMLSIEGSFIWLLLLRNKGVTKVGAPTQLKEQTTAGLGATSERLLTEPVPSVTDHTTRTLEPVNTRSGDAIRR